MPRRATQPAPERVTSETARHGDYQLERREAPNGEIVVGQRNRDASTIGRLRESGALGQDEYDALERLLADRRLVFSSSPRVIASYDPNGAIRSTGFPDETRVIVWLQAKRRLDRIDAEVIGRLGPRDRRVFELIMDGATLAAAGALLESSPAAAKVAAKQTIRLTAAAIVKALPPDSRRAA